MRADRRVSEELAELERRLIMVRQLQDKHVKLLAAKYALSLSVQDLLAKALRSGVADLKAKALAVYDEERARRR